MKKLFLFTIVAMLLFNIACPGKFSSLERDLSQNRQLWTSRNLKDYRYRLQLGCFCPRELTQPVIIEVKNGQRVSIVYEADRSVVANEFFNRFDTIDDVFAFVDDAIDRDASKITVTFNSEFGYPTQVSVDYIELAVDEEMAVFVSDLEAIK